MNIKKAQSWSIDITLAVVILLAAFLTFYALLIKEPGTRAGRLKDEASIVIKLIGSEDASLRIVDNNELNISKVSELKNLNYDELKRRLRIEGDFCIFLEDGAGNIILINNTYKGIGSPTINISGTPCSQR